MGLASLGSPRVRDGQEGWFHSHNRCVLCFKVRRSDSKEPHRRHELNGFRITTQAFATIGVIFLSELIIMFNNSN
jgi:hypothetical protein